MTVEIKKIHDRDITVIRADEGKVFRRKHDGFIMGNEIFLGIDYSTGTARQDLPEYYEEIDAPEEYFEGLEPILPE
jgi:hypothetical protein